MGFGGRNAEVLGRVMPFPVPKSEIYESGEYIHGNSEASVGTKRCSDGVEADQLTTDGAGTDPKVWLLDGRNDVSGPLTLPNGIDAVIRCSSIS